MSKQLLKAEVQKILESDLQRKFPPETTQPELKNHFKEIAEEVVAVVEPFWDIEKAISAADEANFSTKRLIRLNQKLIEDCERLKDAAYEEELNIIGNELNDITIRLSGIKKQFKNHDRRNPTQASLRRPQAEELALRIIHILRSYNVEIKGCQRCGKMSTAVAIIQEIFDVVFRGWFSQPGSITNLITNLRKKEQEAFKNLIKDPALKISEDELAEVLQDLKDFTF